MVIADVVYWLGSINCGLCWSELMVNHDDNRGLYPVALEPSNQNNALRLRKPTQTLTVTHCHSDICPNGGKTFQITGDFLKLPLTCHEVVKTEAKFNDHR